MPAGLCTAVGMSQVRGTARGQEELTGGAPQLSPAWGQGGGQGGGRSGSCPPGRPGCGALPTEGGATPPSASHSLRPQSGPRNPAGQWQAPVATSQEPPLRHPHSCSQPGPKRPGGHPAGGEAICQGPGGGPAPPMQTLWYPHPAPNEGLPEDIPQGAQAALTPLAAGAVEASSTHAGPRGRVAGLVPARTLARLPTAVPKGAGRAGWGAGAGSVLAQPGDRHPPRVTPVALLAQLRGGAEPPTAPGPTQACHLPCSQPGPVKPGGQRHSPVTWWQAVSGRHWQRWAQASPNQPCGQAAEGHRLGGTPGPVQAWRTHGDPHPGSRSPGCWRNWGLTVITEQACPSWGAEAGPGDMVAGGAPPAGTALLTASPKRALGTGCRTRQQDGCGQTYPTPSGGLPGPRRPHRGPRVAPTAAPPPMCQPTTLLRPPCPGVGLRPPLVGPVGPPCSSPHPSHSRLWHSPRSSWPQRLPTRYPQLCQQPAPKLPGAPRHPQCLYPQPQVPCPQGGEGWKPAC